MTLLDFPLEARLRGIEDRLSAIELDVAVIKTRLSEIDKRILSPWLFFGLIMPLYALMILGFAGVFYFVIPKP